MAGEAKNLQDQGKVAAELMTSTDAVLIGLGSPKQGDRIKAVEELVGCRGVSAVALLAVALNDRVEYVAAAAAQGLASINSDTALAALCKQFEADLIPRPHYLSHAIAQFGNRGVAALVRYARSESATLRYFAVRGLGETGASAARPLLEEIAASDSAVTSFGALVSTGAKKGLKTWRKVSLGR